MEEKAKKIIITYFSSTDVLATEMVCKDKKIGGRIISTPPHIAAGCGMSYIIGIEKKDEIEKVLSEEKIKFDKIIEVNV
jgi:hypothetical protein